MKDVEWTEVVAYLLTVEDDKDACKKNKSFDIDERFNQWWKSSHQDLMNELHTRFSGNRAARWLRENPYAKWTLRELSLGNLRLRGGPSRTKRYDFAQQHGGRPRVKDFAEYVCSLPCSEIDPSIRCFIPRKNYSILNFSRKVIARYENWKGRYVWQLGDGYHRAVVLYSQGERTVESYTTIQDPPAQVG